MTLSNISLFRRIFLPLLKWLNPGDITIRHHYTGEKVRLHSFRHKGYWYHGRNRELETMELFKRFLKAGDNVIEVGGHIGYISLYLKRLVGNGEVYVFEPGANNLPYIRRNLKDTLVHLIEKAAGDRNGEEVFYLETLTGQNNSFVPDFKELKSNSENSFTGKPRITEVKVEMVRLDDFLRQNRVAPSFIKVDVEGFELSVLKGAAETLHRLTPKMMVEVQADEEGIYALLSEAGYVLFNASLKICSRPKALLGNVFALHRTAHKSLIDELRLRP